MSIDEIRTRLAAFLEKKTASEADVERLELMQGGASRASYAFDVTLRRGDWAGVHRCVLRLDLGGVIYDASLSRAEEFAVLQEARAGGVKAPRGLWCSDDPKVLGRDFLIMDRIDGETVGSRILKRPELADARRELPRELGEQLAKIHALAPGALDFLPRPEPKESPAHAALRRARRELDAIDEPHPALEIGWRWLHENAPDCRRHTLVHGDYRLGNLVVSEAGLEAVLDWEFAAVGDPHEDLAWPFVRDWRFRNDAKRFAGLSDGGDFLAAYEAAGGATIDERALAYWEILGNFRWALGCLTQARRHLSGKEPSVELASLGRRAAEMELEMMDLIPSFEHATRRDGRAKGTSKRGRKSAEPKEPRR